jgi:glutamate-1-semialdehyde 2,1-aminomutase
MILGYNHPVIDEAAQAQYRKGNTVSLAAPVMFELAEVLVDMVDAADWALFGKNGGDSTSLAVRIARAATGRKKIVKVKDGYHGVAPWMMASMGDTRVMAGITPEDGANMLEVAWNDADGFEELIREQGDDIACFISSPYDHPVMRDNTLPEDGYWQRMETLCRSNGIVLIMDDVRAGFRINLAGSNVAYGFTPDLICFGKALANGYPLSALVGTDALREAATKVFYTGTQFFNAAPMAAAKATLEELQKVDAATQMTGIGTALNEGLVNVARQQGYELVTSGIPAMPYYRLANVSTETHFAWIDECVKRGIYLLGYHNHFVSTAHTDADLARTFDVANDAFIGLGDAARLVNAD